MAGDWIKMRNNLWNDPRVSQVCDTTGASEATVIGGLYWLWATADEHTESGYMPGLSISSIDRKTNVAGLGTALASIGWIDESASGITIARFGEHNGSSAKRRSADAQRKAGRRNLSVPDTDKVGTPSGHNAQISGARIEKSREEIQPLILNRISVTSKADDEISATTNKSNCPHQEIIAIYHEVLPQCPQVRDWTPSRATQLRARWNEDEQRQNLTYWRRFFEYVSTCDFLVGKSGKGPFIADLAWMTKSANFVKIRESKYENRGTR